MKNLSKEAGYKITGYFVHQNAEKQIKDSFCFTIVSESKE